MRFKSVALVGRGGGHNTQNLPTYPTQLSPKEKGEHTLGIGIGNLISTP